MNIIETELAGAFIVEPEVIGDHRGYFFEAYSQKKFEENNIFIDFVQDNQSFNANAGTLRGLHFQTSACPQGKLVRCLSGAIIDVAVDLRKKSKTYKKWIAIELNDTNKKQLFVPRGFAHGFLTLVPNTVICYKVDNYYSPESDAGIKWNDPEIAVDWGIKDSSGIILSEKDKKQPLFQDSRADF